MNIEWKASWFEELSTNELYDIFNIRATIFVVEQNINYVDTDYKDQKALHLCGYIDKKLIGYCRIFKAGDYFQEGSIGRVAIVQHCRGYGLGHELVTKAIETIGTILHESEIKISAQAHLQAFYESHGFIIEGEKYMEENIPHIRMKRIN